MKKSRQKVSRVRLASGTGILLGLLRGQLDVAPTTAHFMTYYDGRCSANCQFCPQARDATTNIQMLSRVTWPALDFELVLKAMRENGGEFKRICIQAVNYKEVINDICEITKRVLEVCELPVSVSCPPMSKHNLQKLAEVGVERVNISLDAATPKLFEKIKGNEVGGPFSWKRHLAALKKARLFFGVSTHLIIGLGESEKEAVETIQFLNNQGITVALFAFTPIAGTPLASKRRPDVASYRRVQLARYLIASDISSFEHMRFDGGRVSDFGVTEEALLKTIESGEPFRTSGCSNCNRPFYNESPRGPVYNYPREPAPNEIAISDIFQ